MAKDKTLSYCGAELRQFDRDRYLTALFAPRVRREALFALYAFNLEIARIAEATEEPLIGEIRLQWWRDVIAGAYEGGDRVPHQHAVAECLQAAIVTYDLTQRHFDRLLDARLFDYARRAPADFEELQAYGAATSGGLQCLALEILGVRNNARAVEAAEAVGLAWALTGLLRAVPFHGRAGRLYLPADLLGAAGVAADALPLGKSTPAMADVGATLADAARSALSRARQAKCDVPAAALPALLPGALADRYLQRIEKAGYDLFDPRIAAPPPFREIGLWLRARRGAY